MDPLRVMSFNLRYGTARDRKNRWDLRKDAVVAAIIKFDPDLLGIQEGLLFQLEFLKARLEGYEYTGVGRDDGQQAGEFAAIFYKSLDLEFLRGSTFWYSDTPSTPSRTWGNHCLRICTCAQFRMPVTGRTFSVFNTHFDLKAKVREKSAYLLQQKIHELFRGEPVIVTGDFNCSPTSKPYEILTSAGLRDSFAARLPHVPANIATFHNWKGKKSTRFLWRVFTRIDWILHSPHFEVVAHDMLLEPIAGRYPSDHFPIVADLRSI
jgi:endonuclease/exonuclease/phosphatase family metal-dependent hydrolase